MMWYFREAQVGNPVDSLSGNFGNILFRLETNLDYLSRKCPDQTDVIADLLSDLEKLKTIKGMIEATEVAAAPEKPI